MKKNIKKIVIFFVFLFFQLNLSATIYYVSNTGSDANNGTSISTPWQSINKVNSFSFVAGDKILFNKGNIFYGTIIVKTSGAAGNPIIYSSYGTGNKPIITGFQTISSWTNLGTNIWESTNTVSSLSTLKMVVVNGVNTPMGRYPNASLSYPFLPNFIYFQSHSGTGSGNTSITSSSLTSGTNWTGADVVVRVNHWTLDKERITSGSGSTISYVGQSAGIVDNWGFFIQNDPRTLDVQNEWYYNPSTHKIRIYSTSTPTNVQVTTIDTLVISHSHTNITFDNLDFEGANTSAIVLTNADGCAVTNCNINYTGENSINLDNGDYVSTEDVENNTITNCGSSAVWISGGDQHTIKNNTVIGSGVISVIKPNDYTNGAIYLNSHCDNSLVQYNIVDSSGYCGIQFRGAGIQILNNFVNHSAIVRDDAGGIYTGYANETGKVIDGNIVINSIGNSRGTGDGSLSGNGIYIDDLGNNMTITNNTIANCPAAGLFLHNNQNVNVHDNTIYNNGSAQWTGGNILVQNGTGTPYSGYVTGNNVTRNILFAKNTNQWSLFFYAQDNTNTVQTFGTLDSNYYAKPIDITSTVNTNDLINAGNYFHYTIPQWQSYSGKDLHTLPGPKTIADTSELKFVYNPNKTNLNITLQYTYEDVRGNQYNTGSIILAPFTSAVLIKTGTLSAYNGKYYISTSGSDNNDGFSSLTPFKTIDKLNTIIFKPGDSILFRRGDTFYGTLVIKQSGTTGNPISIDAYGTGNKPIITGNSTLSNWTSYNSNIQKCAVNLGNHLEVVTINGKTIGRGRYPNTGFKNYSSFVEDQSITDPSLSSTPNWTGAEVVMRKTTWTIDRNTITNHSGSTLTFTPGSTWETMSNGWGYFIQNSLATLDTLNEWYYDGTYLYMYFGGNNPSNYTVQAAAKDTLISIANPQNYISIKNLQLTGADNSAIDLNDNDFIDIENCDFTNIGVDGINAHWGCTNLTIKNNTFDNTYSMAISMGDNSDNTYIGYNNIKNTNRIYGSGEYGTGANWDGLGDGINASANNNQIIEYNVLDSIGHTGLRIGGQNDIVRYNTINHIALRRDDAGAIYAWTGGTAMTGSIILNNIVLSPSGTWEGINKTDEYQSAEGIYLDYVSGVSILGNTVYNANGLGIQINGGQNLEIHDNTIFDAKISSIGIGERTGDLITTTNISRNKFISKTLPVPYLSLPLSNQGLNSAALRFNSSANSTFPNIGNVDSNYYARPIQDSLVINTSMTSGNQGWWGTERTLANWQAFSGKDIHSHGSPKSITDTNDLRFEYNTSTFPKTVTLDANYIDITGAAFNGTVTIPAFGSWVGIKTTAITLLPAVNPSNTVNGLEYKYYEGVYNMLPNFGSLTPVKIGTVNNFDISVANKADSFAFEFTGYINVPTDGQYTFYTNSDDGSKLYIDNVLVVNNDSLHSATEKFGTIGLKAGKHAITVDYFEKNGDNTLIVSYSSSTISKQTIPSLTLYNNYAPITNPTSNAGADQTIYLTQGNSVTLTGSATNRNTSTWSEVSTDYMSGATITNPSSLTTTVTGLPQGTFYFKLDVVSSTGVHAYDTVVVRVDYTTAPANSTVLRAIAPVFSSMVPVVNDRTDTTNFIAGQESHISFPDNSNGEIFYDRARSNDEFIDNQLGKFYSTVEDGYQWNNDGYSRSEMSFGDFYNIDSNKTYVFEWKGYFPQDMIAAAASYNLHGALIMQIHGGASSTISDGPMIELLFMHDSIGVQENFNHPESNGGGGTPAVPQQMFVKGLFPINNLFNQAHTIQLIVREGMGYPGQDGFVEFKLDGQTIYYRNNGNVFQAVQDDYIKFATFYDYDNNFSDPNNFTRHQKTSLVTEAFNVYTVPYTIIAAPTIYAGNNDTSVISTTLTATYTLATGHTGTFVWTQEIKPSGTADVTFTSPNSYTTVVNGLVAGDYRFGCTLIQDDGQSAYDYVLVHVPSAPVVNAGTNQIIFKGNLNFKK